MNVPRLIAHLESLGIRLWLDGEQLRYKAPKNALTGPVRAQIMARKPEIMAFLAQARQAADGPFVQPVARDGGRDGLNRFPLSFAQQRLWFLAQLESGSDVYNIPAQFRLRGPLNVTALEQSLRQLERRHESLRTTFQQVDGQVTQQINPPGFSLTLIDLSGMDSEQMDSEQQERDVTRLCHREANATFDLVNGPLWKATLLRLHSQEHVLLLTLHHIISDGWSLGILLYELSALYRAALQPQQGNPLPELPVQYADFAVWQRDWLQGEALQEQLAYWKEHLAGAPSLLALPTDHPRPAVQSDRGGHFYFSLSPELTRKLKQLSQESRATLFMTLQAAFAVLLSRYAGQEDVLIGTPIANRQVAEIENLVGLFLNALVLRNDLSGNPTFRALLDRVRHVALDAYQRQALPFEMLVEALQPERTLSHSPVFQVMFNLLNNRQDALVLAGVESESIEVEYPVAKHDLILTMQEESGQDGDEILLAMLEYSTDLFEPQTIERMAGHFQTLLAGIVADPDASISHLPLLTPTERHQLLVEWNARWAERPNLCFHELFETQAARTPDAQAVRCRPYGEEEAVTLTYRELDERANQLAHHLQDLGVTPEDIVGVCMERSPETIISMLAIFKAGGCYVPLDLSLPKERLTYMIAQSGTEVVLTKQLYLEQLTVNSGQIVCVDRDEARISASPRQTPANVSTPGSLAYVLFTSGSTGLPKAVMIEHRGMVNNLYVKIEDHGIVAGDRIAQTAQTSFDISIWQLLAGLLVGGTVCIFDDETARDPVRLLAQTEAEGIAVLEVVPSLFRFMLSEVTMGAVPRPDFSALRWVSLTGEALPPDLCNEWLALYPQIPIMNAYGPAECSDDATHHVIQQPLPASAVTVPIGRVIPNVKLYVLDQHGEPVPIGVPGELYVGGVGVGRGYLNDPERTAQAFMPNPFVEDDQARLYRTGDAVRYRDDGTLEFLGRLDYQVKIRGTRIELGEIESLLRQHVTVEDAVAAVRSASGSESQLVGYVTLSQQGKTENARARLQEEQVALWQTLHDQSYQETLLLDGDPTLNVTGWDSNYTGEPLPPAEMHEYIDGTLARALAVSQSSEGPRQPRRVLEIGCGTGLLAFRLIPQVDLYHGVDTSRAAVEQLQALHADPAIQARVPGAEQARFEVRSADDLSGLEASRFDLVMLPSVVQYFPSVDYLHRVLARLVDLLGEGGKIFLGDVRHLGLLEAFHASVQLHRADASATAESVGQRVWQQMQSEQEMALDPAFFVALARTQPGITHVEILPKRGTHQNEMTRFRYDVVLHVGGPSAAAAAVDGEWQDWTENPLSLAEIEARLQTREHFGLRGVKNQRVAAALAGLDWIDQADPRQTVAQFAKSQSLNSDGLEPEDLWRLAQGTGHRAVISLSRGAADGSFDVLFGRNLPERVAMPIAAGSDSTESEPEEAAYWDQFANNPLREQQARELIPLWREHLTEHLPSYMVPNRFVLLDAMPLTPNGKINRNALPTPDTARPLSSQGYAPPSTSLEASLAAIWQEVLDLERVSIHDNFFEIGGHSLLATQVISRVRRSQQIELPLRQIFAAPTVAELAEQIEKLAVNQMLQQTVSASETAREEITL